MAVHWGQLDIDRPDWLGGGQWMLRGLTDVTLIFARNGIGKSILLRSIAESDRYAVSHYASPERGGEISYNQSFNERELKSEGRGS